MWFIFSNVSDNTLGFPGAALSTLQISFPTSFTYDPSGLNTHWKAKGFIFFVMEFHMLYIKDLHYSSDLAIDLDCISL